MLNINPDIRKAHTLPAQFYREPSSFETVSEKVFARTWNFICDAPEVAEPGQVYPFTLLDNVVTEPLVFSRDLKGELHCLSNVCTHRGKIIVEAAGRSRGLTCGYHGRCFRLDGTYKSMPAFEEVLDFPSEKDHLTKVPHYEWANMLFTAIDPAVPFPELIAPMTERLSWMPLDELKFDAGLSRDYYVHANWALYCDNYLEGFHVPFVHPALNSALELEAYDYQLFPYCNLQLGIANEGEQTFDLPPESPDYGQRVFAYYFWVFPNLMFNWYPWGLSLNVVEPLSYNKTRIRFRTYLFEGTKHDPSDQYIHQTELEDEAVVESVQKGLQSRFYHTGRYAPKMEQCVHHFHRLIARFMEA